MHINLCKLEQVCFTPVGVVVVLHSVDVNRVKIFLSARQHNTCIGKLLMELKGGLTLRL